MAITQDRMPTDEQNDRPEVPDGWNLIEDRTDRPYNARAAWAHEETGQTVYVNSVRRPTQMHTPETSTDDTGFIAKVKGEYGAQLSYDLASKDRAFEAAISFMSSYPDGEFEVPHPRDQDAFENGPISWEADNE